MGDFSEKIKKRVREKANFRCCRCQEISIEVHHILPQKDGGGDDFDNAAPLCANCHANFGDNPRKRKEIREMRDWWYKKCEEIFKAVVLLKEKPEPRTLTKVFPFVLFYHQEKGYLHWIWPNEFNTYYLFAAFAIQELAKTNPEIYKKIAKSDFDFRGRIFVDLIEWLIFNWLSRDYHACWLLERKRYRFPWASEMRASGIKTSEIGSETINYLDNEEFKKNVFYPINMGFSKFAVPKGTTVTISRDSEFPKTTIVMENDFYRIHFEASFSGGFLLMRTPEWLSGLTEQQQKAFAIMPFDLFFRGEPNAEKLTDEKMSFYQKWAEDLCQEFQENFDWLTTFNRIKDWQFFRNP